RRSRRRSAAACKVKALSFARPLPGVIVTTREPIRAMISITAMTSIRVKPDLRSVLDIRDVGCAAGSALMAIRAVRDNLVGGALDRGVIQVGMAPRIVRHAAAFDIGSIPNLYASRPLHQSVETLGG